MSTHRVHLQGKNNPELRARQLYHRDGYHGFEVVLHHLSYLFPDVMQVYSVLSNRLFLLPIPQFFSSLGWTTLIGLILCLTHYCRLEIILPTLFQMSHIGKPCSHWSFTCAEWKSVDVSGYKRQYTSYSSIFSPVHSSTSPNWGPTVTVEPLWLTPLSE